MQNNRKYAHLLLLLALMSVMSSCKLFRNSPKHETKVLSDKITTLARAYEGVPYRLGGNDFSGIDCSGLVFNIFKEIGMKIPRVSWQQAEYFMPIDRSDIQKGDLVFFITNGGKYINHAGIVTQVTNKNEVRFISALTSRGVAEDNLFSNYWRGKLAKVARASLK